MTSRVVASLWSLAQAYPSEFHREADTSEVLLIDVDSLAEYALAHASLAPQYGGISSRSVIAQASRLLDQFDARKVRYELLAFDALSANLGKTSVPLSELESISIANADAITDSINDAIRAANMAEEALLQIDENVHRRDADLAAAPSADRAAGSGGRDAEDSEEEEEEAEATEAAAAAAAESKAAGAADKKMDEVDAEEAAAAEEEIDVEAVSSRRGIEFRARFPKQYLLLRSLLVSVLKSRPAIKFHTFSSWYAPEFSRFLSDARIFAVLLSLGYDRTTATNRASLFTVFDAIAVSVMLQRIAVGDLQAIRLSAGSLNFSTFAIDREDALLKINSLGFTSEACKMFDSLFPHVGSPSQSNAPFSGELMGQLDIVHSIVEYLMANAPLSLRLIKVPQISRDAPEFALSTVTRSYLEHVCSTKLQSLTEVDARFFFVVLLFVYNAKGKISVRDMFTDPRKAVLSLVPGALASEQGAAADGVAAMDLDDGEAAEEDEDEVVDNWEDLLSDEEEEDVEMDGAASGSSVELNEALVSGITKFLASRGLKDSMDLVPYHTEISKSAAGSDSDEDLDQTPSDAEIRRLRAELSTTLPKLSHSLFPSDILSPFSSILSKRYTHTKMQVAARRFFRSMKLLLTPKPPPPPKQLTDRQIKRQQQREAEKFNRLQLYSRSLHGDKEPRKIFPPAFYDDAKKKRMMPKVEEELGARIPTMDELRKRAEKLLKAQADADAAAADSKNKGKKVKKEKKKAPTKKELMLEQINKERAAKAAAKSGAAVAEVKKEDKKRNQLEQLTEIPDDLDWMSSTHNQEEVLRLNNRFAHDYAHLAVPIKNRALRVLISSAADSSAIEGDGTRPLIPLNDSQEKMMQTVLSSIEFTPDLWQMRALEAIFANMSLLAIGPTASGKTFLSYVAMERVLREDRSSRVVFVAPTVTLVTQTYCEVFGMMQLSNQVENKTPMIGYVNGEDKLNPEARILVTVPETFYSLLLTDAGLRNSLRYVIFDEAHNIGDPQTGALFSNCMSMANVPILALSASVGNAEDVYGFMKTLDREKPAALIQVGERVTDLLYGTIYPTLGEKGVSGGDMRAFHPFTFVDLRQADRFPALAPRHIVPLYEALAKAFEEEKMTSSEGFTILDEHFNIESCPYFENEIVTRQLVRKYDANLRDYLAWLGRTPQYSSVLYKARDVLRKQEDFYSVMKAVDQYPEMGQTAYGIDYERHPVYILYKTLERNRGLPSIVFNLDRTACSVAAHQLTVFLESDAIKERYFKDALTDAKALRLLLQRIEYHMPSPEAVFKFFEGHAEHAQFVSNVVSVFLSEMRSERETITDIEKEVNTKLEELEKALQFEKLMEKRGERPGANKSGAKNESVPLQQELNKLEGQRKTLEYKVHTRTEDLRKEMFARLPAAVVDRVIRFLIFDYIDQLVTTEDTGQHLQGIWDDKEQETKILKEIGMRHGIAAHHGQVNRKKMFVIESNMRLGKMRLIFATGTLAQGINTPARSIVFMNMNMRYMYPTLFQQCAGRSGRRGFKESYGYVLFFGLPSRAQQRLICSDLPFLLTKFPLSTVTSFRLLHSYSPQISDVVKRVLHAEPLSLVASATLAVKLGLLDEKLEKSELSSIVYELWKETPAIFVLLYALSKGDLDMSEANLVHTVFASLFTKQKAARGHPYKRAFVPKLPTALMRDFREFERMVVSHWAVCCRLFVQDSAENVEGFFGALFNPEQMWTVKARCIESAVGAGQVDSFADKRDLLDHAAASSLEIHEDTVPVPELDTLLDSYVTDYYRDHSIKSLVLENKLMSGEAKKLVQTVGQTASGLRKSLIRLREDETREDALGEFLGRLTGIALRFDPTGSFKRHYEREKDAAEAAAKAKK
jgi:superfamily II DNA/RNA helicase